jgi:hypothetical protein
MPKRRLGHAVARKTATQSRRPQLTGAQKQARQTRPVRTIVTIPEFSGDRALAREQARGTKPVRSLVEKRRMEGTPVYGRPPLTPYARKVERHRARQRTARNR